MLMLKTREQRKQIADTSLAAFKCTKKQLSDGYLKNAEQLEKCAIKASTMKNGMYRKIHVSQWNDYVKFTKLMAQELLED